MAHQPDWQWDLATMKPTGFLQGYIYWPFATPQGGGNIGEIWKTGKNFMEDFIKRGKSGKVHAKTGKNFQRGGGNFYIWPVYIPLHFLEQELLSCDVSPIQSSPSRSWDEWCSPEPFDDRTCILLCSGGLVRTVSSNLSMIILHHCSGIFTMKLIKITG